MVCQDISEKVIRDLYNQTFKSCFKNRDSTNASITEYYILTDSLPAGLQDSFLGVKLHFITRSQAYPLIKKGKMNGLYGTSFKKISNETLDLSVGSWAVKYERVFRLQKLDGRIKLITGNYNFVASCGGDLGYIPDGRIIYNHNSGKWDFFDWNSIADQKLAKQKNNAL